MNISFLHTSPILLDIGFAVECYYITPTYVFMIVNIVVVVLENI